MIHRYRPEIPEPAPSLQQNGAPIGGIWGFPRDQNNHLSSAYVLWSEHEDKHSWNAAWCAKIIDSFCVLFPRVVGKTLNTLNWNSMADDAITQGGIEVPGSLFYICDVILSSQKHVFIIPL